jgi:hypothetical protein
MSGKEAVGLLIKKFPQLEKRVDEPADLYETPNVTYGLLASELLENSSDETLLNSAAQFINELANSGDDLLEELLVIDVLEGLAQSPDLARTIGLKINAKAGQFLERVEREYFGR